jgi:hypothetical protein
MTIGCAHQEGEIYMPFTLDRILPVAAHLGGRQSGSGEVGVPRMREESDPVRTKRRARLTQFLRLVALLPPLCVGAAALAANADVTTPRYRLTKGKGYSMCEAYAASANALPAEDPPMLCEQKALSQFRLPQWDALDLEDHLSLVYQASMLLPPYDQRGVAHPPLEDWRKDFLARVQRGELKPRLRRSRLALNERGVETLILYEPDVTACERYKVAAGGHLFVLRDGSRLEAIVGLSTLWINVLGYHDRAAFTFLAAESDAAWITGLYTVYPKRVSADQYVLRDLCEVSFNN